MPVDAGVAGNTSGTGSAQAIDHTPLADLNNQTYRHARDSKIPQDRSVVGQMYPLRPGRSNPESVDRLRDIVQLNERQHFTQFGVLGQRQFDPSLVDTIKTAADDINEMALEEFVSAQLYDSNSIEGRRMMDRLLPDRNNRRKQYLSLALRQLEFISRKAMDVEFQSLDEVKRVIRILGAGEPLLFLTHPALRAVVGAPAAAADQYKTILGGDPLYGYFTPWDSSNPWYKHKAAHKNARIAIAEMFLPHFPKTMYGDTDHNAIAGVATPYKVWTSDMQNTSQPKGDAAKNLVAQCEIQVKRLSTGYAADMVLSQLRDGGRGQSGGTVWAPFPTSQIHTG